MEAWHLNVLKWNFNNFLLLIKWIVQPKMRIMSLSTCSLFQTRMPYFLLWNTNGDFFLVFYISLPVLLHHWAKLENLDQYNFFFNHSDWFWMIYECVSADLLNIWLIRTIHSLIGHLRNAYKPAKESLSKLAIFSVSSNLNFSLILIK